MEKLDKLKQKRKEINLKMMEGDTRMLNKIKKWTSITIDCRKMLKDKEYKVSFERIKEI